MLIIQFHHYNPDTNGTEESVRASEVSLFLGLYELLLARENASLIEKRVLISGVYILREG